MAWESAIYKSKLLCGSINKHGMWTKNYFIVKKKKCLKIPWWSDIPLKSYKRKKYIVDQFPFNAQNQISVRTYRKLSDQTKYK